MDGALATVKVVVSKMFQEVSAAINALKGADHRKLLQSSERLQFCAGKERTKIGILS